MATKMVIATQHRMASCTGDENKRRGRPKRKSKSKQQARKARQPRKYLNLKLAALGARTGNKSSSGDALLQLLLFESDSIVRMDPDEDGNEKISYRGEAAARTRDGTSSASAM